MQFLQKERLSDQEICAWCISCIERVASGIHIAHLYQHEINIRVHSSRDLNNIIALIGILMNLVIRKQEGSRKQIGFIFRARIHGIKDIFTERAVIGEMPMKGIMTELMSANQGLHLFRQVIIQKDKAVALNYTVKPFQLGEVVAEQDLNAQAICNGKGIACSEAPDIFFSRLMNVPLVQSIHPHAN